MATLAAMPKGPSRYNPLKNPDLSKERRAVVLTLMEQQGYITAEEAAEAKKWTMLIHRLKDSRNIQRLSIMLWKKPKRSGPYRGRR